MVSQFSNLLRRNGHSLSVGLVFYFSDYIWPIVMSVRFLKSPLPAFLHLMKRNSFWDVFAASDSCSTHARAPHDDTSKKSLLSSLRQLLSVSLFDKQISVPDFPFQGDIITHLYKMVFVTTSILLERERKRQDKRRECQPCLEESQLDTERAVAKSFVLSVCFFLSTSFFLAYLLPVFFFDE